MKSSDNVGVTFVNVLVGQGVLNGVVNLQFGAYHFTPNGEAIDPDLVVACRMRMDIECAKQLYNSLAVLISASEKEAGEAPPPPAEGEPKVAKTH